MNTNPLVSSIGYIGNPARLPINHPLADGISFFRISGDEAIYELAFFKNGDWVTETIPFFGTYAESAYPGMRSRVYQGIPKKDLQDFLEIYKDW